MNNKRYIINFLMVIIALFFLVPNAGYVEKINFEPLQAEKMLKEIYKPLEDFNKNLILTEDPKLLLVPSNIKNEEDFFNLFNNKISDFEAKEIYEILITKKNEKLYIDSLIYIPNIYSEGGKVTEAYIKKKNYIFTYHNHKYEETLIIKESWKISGEINKRTNEFVKNEEGEWVLHSSEGLKSYKFIDINENPWH